jgi:outer membrane protein
MKKALFIAGLTSLVAANASALTLQEGLNIVFDENPNLQAVKKDVKIKEELKSQAVSGFMPDVEANYSLQDQHTKFQDSISADSSPSTGSVTLTQPLFTGGATLAGFKAAKYNEQSAENNYKNQQQVIFRNAANAYLTVMTAQEVFEFNQRQVATNTEEMKRVKQRFELGDITLPNLKEFEARLSGYIAEKEQAHGNLLAAKSGFATVFGRTAADLSWPQIDPNLPATLDEALAAAKDQNPKIKKAKLDYKASKQGINVARANFMPTVAAVASWSNNSNNYGATDTNVTTVGVQASIPLFKGGENASKYTQSKLESRQADDALNQTIRNVEATTSNAFNNVLVQIQRVKALKVRLDSFTTTKDAVEKQEEAGEASIIDVLDARDDEFSAKVDLQIAKQELVLAKLDLLASVGKFTYEDMPALFNSTK